MPGPRTGFENCKAAPFYGHLTYFLSISCPIDDAGAMQCHTAFPSVSSAQRQSRVVGEPEMSSQGSRAGTCSSLRCTRASCPRLQKIPPTNALGPCLPGGSLLQFLHEDCGSLLELQAPHGQDGEGSTKLKEQIIDLFVGIIHKTRATGHTASP